MSKALVDLVRAIRVKAAKAYDKKKEYDKHDRRKDSNEIKNTANHLAKDLGQTRTTNQIISIVKNLCAELEKGDMNVNLGNVVNYCDTIYNNL